MVNACCVCRVEKSAHSEDLAFHGLPNDPEIRSEWLKVLNKGNVKNLLVCSKHFTPEDYRESSLRPLLKKNAVPRLNLLKELLSRQKDENNKNTNHDDKFDDSVDKIKSEEKTQETIHDHNYSKESSEEGTLSVTDVVNNSETVKDKQTDCDEAVNSPDAQCANILKRKSDSQQKSDASIRKRCVVNEFGVLRHEDFKNEDAWRLFLDIIDKMKKENASLKKKNLRLQKKVESFQNIISRLKRQKSTAKSSRSS